MENRMSLGTKKEVLGSIQSKYQQTKRRKEKIKILDAFITTTGYERKYAISLLNQPAKIATAKHIPRPVRKYDQAVQMALITIWNAANRICSKRLVPFIPQMIEVLERNGHIYPSNFKMHSLIFENCH